MTQNHTDTKKLKGKITQVRLIARSQSGVPDGFFLCSGYLSGDLERFRSRERWRLREGETLRSLSRERLRFLSRSLVPEESASFLSVESAAICTKTRH